MNRSKQGRKGEDEAVLALEKEGFKIIARNVRSERGEVDIVALDKESIIFIEVKRWSSYGIETLQYSINKKKQERIILTAKDFLAVYREFEGLSVRFDVVFIDSHKYIRIESAFVEDC
jgi:putative endonuclease